MALQLARQFTPGFLEPDKDWGKTLQDGKTQFPPEIAGLGTVGEVIELQNGRENALFENEINAKKNETAKRIRLLEILDEFKIIIINLLIIDAKSC